MRIFEDLTAGSHLLLTCSRRQWIRSQTPRPHRSRRTVLHLDETSHPNRDTLIYIHIYFPEIFYFSALNQGNVFVLTRFRKHTL